MKRFCINFAFLLTMVCSIYAGIYLNKGSEGDYTRRKGVINSKESGSLFANSQKTVNGCIMSASNWSEYDISEYKIWSIPLQSADMAEFTQISTDVVNANAGGVSVGNVYHCVLTFINSYTGERMTYYNTYNNRNWGLLSSTQVSDGLIATDLANDPTTDLIYGCFYTDDMNGYELARIDFRYGIKHRILDLGTGSFIGLAISPQGQMYGISWDSKLYKIDKKTGDLSVVGHTGVKFDKVRQSAFFDEETGEMYFSGYLDNNNAGLYKINTETGVATLMAKYPHAEQFVGAYMPKLAAGDDTPYRASSLTADFSEDNTTGNFSFTLPRETVGGDDLTGAIDYKLVVNGVTKADAQGQPGSKVTCENITVESGQVKFVVTCSNNAGTGEEASLVTYIGYDVPLAPANVQLSISDDGAATITWDHTLKGMNDKDISASNLTYSIVRYPDQVEVAKNFTGSSYTDKIDSELLNKYYYLVTPYNNGVEGLSGFSNNVVYGNYIEFPYLQNFEDSDALDFFTVVNSNGDAAKWGLDSEGHVSYTSIFAKGPADDWLIMPALRLYADRSYTFSFKASGRVALGFNGNTENFDVYYGKGKTPADMTDVILENGSIDSYEFKTFTFTVRPKTDGDYSIGFHVTTPKASQANKLILDDIEFDLYAVNEAPGAVEELKVTPGQKGEKNASISFIAPDKNSVGDNLTTITHIDIFRDDKKIGIIENPTVGKPYSYADNDPENGLHTYSIIAYNEAGKGVTASAEAFIGVDKPLPPTNVVLKEIGEDKVQVTWTPPTMGVNGGYIDTENLTYRVQRSDNAWMTMSQKGATEFTSDESSVSLIWRQDDLFYHVHASNKAGESGRGTSNKIVIGNPYLLPYFENFKTGYTDTERWSNIGPGKFVTNNNDGLSSDGDNHCALFIPTSENKKAEYVSPKISLDGTVQPALRLNYYATPGQDASLKIAYQKNADNDTTMLADLDFRKMTGEPGWRDTIIDITGAEEARYVRIHFEADCRDGLTRIAFDDIQLREMVPYNVKAALSSPRYVRAAEDNKFILTVTNIGTRDANGFTLRLFADNEEVVSMPGNKIPVNGSEQYTLTWKPELTDEGVKQIHAVADYMYDADTDDNETQQIPVLVEHSAYPSVDLKGSVVNAESVLSWEAPEIVKGKVSDDFEQYSMDDFRNFGNWNTYDGDGGGTWKIHEFGDFPGSGEAMSWILFNTANADDRVKAHSGNQFLLTVSANYIDAIVNENWLMSPQLSGEEQEIEFWYRVLDTTVPEKIRVLYSYNSNHYEDFIELETISDLTNNEWVKHTATLPEGSRFFAIEYVTPTLNPDGFAIMVDDIAYDGIGSNLEIVGYNIYKDGVKEATVSKDVTTWIDKSLDSKDHAYKVSVVYNEGESTYSNEVSLNASRVEGIYGSSIRIIGTDGQICIKGAEENSVSIYTIDGQIVYKGIGDTELRVNPACYIVRVGNYTAKIMIN